MFDVLDQNALSVTSDTFFYVVLGVGVLFIAYCIYYTVIGISRSIAQDEAKVK